MILAAVPITVSQVQAQLYPIHTDHLNTPRLVADDTQKTVWKWEQQEPFGAGACNPDPDGDNVQFEFNLRFPGQNFDRETSAHYNWFRDYDPSIGRYLQSDPIGLKGGIGTFAYVGGDPLRFRDPTGLKIWWDGKNSWSDSPTGQGWNPYPLRPEQSASAPKCTADEPPISPPEPPSYAPPDVGTNEPPIVVASGWKDDRKACYQACQAIGRAMGGVAGQAYITTCVIRCNVMYPKP